MTKEEKKALEDTAKQLREAADQAHQKAGENPGDEDLQAAAEQAEDAAVKAQADVDAAVVDDEPASDEEDEGEDEGDGDGNIDFEKELQQLEQGAQPAQPRTELEKAERALFFQVQKVKELGGDPSKVIAPPPAPVAPPVVVDSPAPKTGEEYINMLDFVEVEFGKIAKTEAERKVYMHHYKHSIQKTGNLATDMENAYLIANKGKIQRSFSEIRRANNTRPAPGTPPGRKPPAKPTIAPKLTPEEQTVMRNRGYAIQADGSWKSRRYTMRFVAGKGWVTTRNQ